MFMFKSLTHTFGTSLRRFARGERGATAIEYALIASGISIAIAATVFTLGSNVTDYYSNVSTALK
jgi:pilus assembly protein Flp/PilA